MHPTLAQELLLEARKNLQGKYRFRVSRSMKSMAYSGEQGRPIYRQFYPSLLELDQNVEFDDDPLQEEHTDIKASDFLIHKYENKVLFLVTSECPVFCRFCTRKRKTLMAQTPQRAEASAREFLLTYLEKNPQINEVIFSGGDPFMLSTESLMQLVKLVSSQKQIGFIRFHTKTVTALAEKITKSFVRQLHASCLDKQAAVVIHINHPAELTPTAQKAIGRLQEKFALYSQSVLLKQINDNAATLAYLFKELAKLQVQPYYLHQLDKISGSQHFYVPVSRGVKIMTDLRTMIPPYILPRYVQDSKEGKKNLFY